MVLVGDDILAAAGEGLVDGGLRLVAGVLVGLDHVAELELDVRSVIEALSDDLQELAVRLKWQSLRAALSYWASFWEEAWPA